MKVSDYVMNFLVSEGVTHIFEVCGGALAHLLDSMYGRKDIKAVSMHHEMAAAIAAEGYSRVSGNLGVAMATSGPGATNLITGIGSCFFDSIPSLFITGQVNTYEYKYDSSVRQIGFQETDIVNMIKPIVKDAILVDDENKMRYILEKAVETAREGRPGPVLVDIPLNIQRYDIDPETLESYTSKCEDSNSEIDDKISEIKKLIETSSRTVVLVGGGLRLSHAEKELFEFINKTKIPVVASLMGLDAFPHDHESFVGMIGTYGNRYANLALSNSDLLIALGTRLDTRQTGTQPETFAREATIIHVDIDPLELNNKIKEDLSINSDLKTFLVKLNEILPENAGKDIKEWKNVIKSFKEKYPSYKKPANEYLDPNFFMHKLSEFLPENAIICVDVGQNQMWAAQSLELKASQRLLTEGGMASIGSAFPMGIGASFAQPERTVVVITGDGGFQLNLQELQTVYHHNLPIKIIMLNNYCYGMIKQFQEQYMDSRFQSTVGGYSAPDFQEVVGAYKLPVMKITKNSELTGSFEKLFKDRSAMFLEVNISSNYKAQPKLSVNRPLEDQEPLLPFEELESNMLIRALRRKE
jgi:acetolactate synthase-1/2/3 large subunit